MILRNEVIIDNILILVVWVLNNCMENGGFLGGIECYFGDFVFDVFFFSVFLFLGIFIVVYGVKIFRNFGFFFNFVSIVVYNYDMILLN